jgi:DNA ligase (NAD+)
LLADEFKSIDALLEATEERLTQVPGVGPIMARDIHQFFKNETERKVIEDLRAAGVKMTQDPKAKPKGGADVTGKTFVVTGTLKKYGRDDIEDLIRSLGGKAAGSVSKSTDYLIAGEKAGSKLERAKVLGVKVLSEEEFDKLIGKP